MALFRFSVARSDFMFDNLLHLLLGIVPLIWDHSASSNRKLARLHRLTSAPPWEDR